MCQFIRRAIKVSYAFGAPFGTLSWSSTVVTIQFNTTITSKTALKWIFELVCPSINYFSQSSQAVVKNHFYIRIHTGIYRNEWILLRRLDAQSL